MTDLRQLMSRYRVTADPLLTERRTEMVAVVLLLLFGLQLLYGGARLATLSLPDSHIVAPESLKVGKVAVQQRVSKEQRNEMLSRPLFWSSRRPAAPVPEDVAELADQAAAIAHAAELGKVKLLGTFGGAESGGIIAMVNGQKERILLNEKAMEWTLDSVQPDRAVFTQGGQTHELVLAYAPLPASAGTPVNPPAAAKGGKTREPSGANKTKDTQRKQPDPNGIKSLGSSNQKSSKTSGRK